MCMIVPTAFAAEFSNENISVTVTGYDVEIAVKTDVGAVLLADIGSFIVIMLFMLIPTLFISKVDPAQTVRMK